MAPERQAEVAVTLAQVAVADGDVARNADRLVDVLETHADSDLVVFPEYALTGFPASPAEAAVTLDEPRVRRVVRAARDAGTEAVVGAVLDDGDAATNATLHVGSDGVTVYRKRHLWGDERGALGAGEAFATVESALGATALATCYDLNFVGDSAALTDRGVEALIAVGAWPEPHAANWRLLLRARALDGVRWVVGVDRPDARDGGAVSYAGRSAVASPRGRIVEELGPDPTVATATLDTATVAEARREIPVVED